MNIDSDRGRALGGPEIVGFMVDAQTRLNRIVIVNGVPRAGFASRMGVGRSAAGQMVPDRFRTDGHPVTKMEAPAIKNDRARLAYVATPSYKADDERDRSDAGCGESLVEMIEDIPCA